MHLQNERDPEGPEDLCQAIRNTFRERLEQVAKHTLEPPEMAIMARTTLDDIIAEVQFGYRRVVRAHLVLKGALLAPKKW